MSVVSVEVVGSVQAAVTTVIDASASRTIGGSLLSITTKEDLVLVGASIEVVGIIAVAVKAAVAKVKVTIGFTLIAAAASSKCTNRNWYTLEPISCPLLWHAEHVSGAFGCTDLSTSSNAQGSRCVLIIARCVKITRSTRM